jgi:hypothetical protein
MYQFGQNPLKGVILVNTRINTFQWILIKLGTYLVLKKMWNPIDFQGQRSRSQGQIFRRGDTPRFAKDYVCTKFGQNPLKDVDSRVFTRMLRGNNLTR